METKIVFIFLQCQINKMDYDIKERIVEESCTLFKKYGIKAVTMDSLATHMGISKRTIYENFSDKDELVLTVMTWMSQQQIQKIYSLQENSESIIDLVFSIIDQVGNMMQEMNPVLFEDIKKYHHLVDRGTMKLMLQDNLALSLPLLQKGIEEGVFRPEINSDIVNRAIHFIFNMTGDFEHFPREMFTRGEVVRNVFVNFLRGISTSKGIELINKCEKETYIKNRD